MAILGKENEAKERFRPGDVFQGYYFPGVQCGRTICYYKDIIYLLRKYKRKIRKVEQIINFKEPGTFSIMSDIYKEIHFSSILFCTELEESSESFQILIGVILKLLNKEIDLETLTEVDNEETETESISYDEDINVDTKKRRMSISAVNEETKNNNCDDDYLNNNDNLMDLRISMIIMQSLEDINNNPKTASLQENNTNKIDNDSLLKNSDFDLLHHNISLIYILYLLHKSQYMTCLEDSFSDLEISNVQRIPITIETFKIIKTIIEKCKSKGNIFPEAEQIIYQLINDDILEINLYDGPQYYYQDRYGNPLMPDPLEKRFADIKSIYFGEKTSDNLNDHCKFLDYLQDLKSRLFDKIRFVTESSTSVNGCDNNFNNHNDTELIASSLKVNKEDILSNYKLLYHELSKKIIEYKNNYSKYKHNYCKLFSNPSPLQCDTSDILNRLSSDEVVNTGNNDNPCSESLKLFNGTYVNWEELFVNDKLNEKQFVDERDKTKTIILDLDNNVNINHYNEKNGKNVFKNAETQVEGGDGNGSNIEYGFNIINSNDDSLKSLLEKIETLVNKKIT
ncbi:apicomplexan conserved protein [Cryptosporidium bovis]|uniref:apicomplexan conserved protein n=1 Tax=Cryptosporidium bovis TaxID=310047 RepID=UPI00351A6925|nr:apicomplexan conserved protein [Cryptosporidium bovis]